MLIIITQLTIFICVQALACLHFIERAPPSERHFLSLQIFPQFNYSNKNLIASANFSINNNKYRKYNNQNRRENENNQN